MASYKRGLSSASTNGLGIKIAATASPGTTIHTAVAGTTNLDEIWLFAVNENTSPVVVTLQWGGTTAVDNSVTFTLPAQCGFIPVSPGLPLQNALVVKAYASVANKVVFYGYITKDNYE